MMKTTQLPLVTYYQAMEEVNLLIGPEKLNKRPKFSKNFKKIQN